MRVLALFLVSVLLTCCAPGKQPTPTIEVSSGFNGEEVDPPQPAPDFDLTDQNGARLRLADLQGQLVLLSFVYTGCPDVCIRLTASFRAVQREFVDALESDLVIVLVSIDPEGDTLERTREWTQALGGRWHYLRGGRVTLERIWDNYGVAVQKTESGLVNHSLRTYLIDRHGLIRVRYGGLGWEQAAIQDISRLLAAGAATPNGADSPLR